jgi:hypothetical protein
MGVFKDIIIDVMNRFDKNSIKKATHHDINLLKADIYNKYKIELDYNDIKMVVDSYGYNEGVVGFTKSSAISERKTSRSNIQNGKSSKD